GAESILEGFTMTGGTGTQGYYYATSYLGGGVFCFRSSPTIKDNVIVNNKMPLGTAGIYGYGGGVACVESNANVVGNTIKSNTAYMGGGVYVFKGGVTIRSNLIFGNSALNRGGGVLARLSEQFTDVMNNTIVANTAAYGGNLYGQGRCQIVSNILANGSATTCGGLMWEGFEASKYYPIAYNNVYNNNWGNYSGLANLTGVDGNISQDPLFVNAAIQDYHLLSDSPCISAGDPSFIAEVDDKDIDTEERIFGKCVDIGADEYRGYIKPIADAGPDQTAPDLPEIVTLDGTDSYFHNLESQKDYAWTQISGPTVVLSGPETDSPAFAPSAPGIYVFELKVADEITESLPERVKIVLGTALLPVAEAGLPRYAATDPVQLDARASYNPNNLKPLGYTWRQVSGPSVTITDSKTATPTISGFMRTSVTQKAVLELVVSDGEQESLPDTVDVIIMPLIPDFPDPYGSTSMIEIVTGGFDPDKPTFVFFGGGSCSYGGWTFSNFTEWWYNANVLNFRWYEPDSQMKPYTYNGCANMLIEYLCRVAPDYKQPIQTWGHSTGVMPAIAVANYLNTTYYDRRYAVNRVSLCDAGSSGDCYDVRPEVAAFNAYPVDGEQCWVDNHYSTDPRSPIDGALNVFFPQNQHRAPVFWFYWSPDESIWQTDQYHGGVTAGTYLSILGPARNLQLTTDPYKITYYYQWLGQYYPDTQPFPTFGPGHLDFMSPSLYSARLPEPVALLKPVYDRNVRGYMLTCKASQNVVGYELLIGSDPYRVMDYKVISDTSTPPSGIVTGLPFKGFWWTIRGRDAFGSTIHADPRYVMLELDALDFHKDGRIDMADFAVMAQYWCQNESAVDVAPWPEGDGIVDVEDLVTFVPHWLQPGRSPGEVARWSLDHSLNDSFGGYPGSAVGAPVLVDSSQAKVGNGAVKLDGVDDFIEIAEFTGITGTISRTCTAWIKANSTGKEQAILSWGNAASGQKWLFRTQTDGKLAVGVWGGYVYGHVSVADGQWHHVAAVLADDGSPSVNEIKLYVDGIVQTGTYNTTQAIDTVASQNVLIGSVYNGTAQVSFFSGLIDEVRIYNQALTQEEILRLTMK
ncbi:MAG: LamG-like jellyroll fold domain-containing protein, partial [Anaerohalosphaeraceae bacterium]